MDSSFPVSEDRTVALTAEVIGLFEWNQVSICKPQLVPVISIMAVETPSLCLSMFQFYIFMEFEFSSLFVDFHVTMTVRTGEYALGERGRGDRENVPSKGYGNG